MCYNKATMEKVPKITPLREGIKPMADEKKSTYRGFTPAQAEAHKRYMKNFVEVKVRMTPEKREIIQAHAKAQGESATEFINRAIDNQMEQDKA